MRQILVMLFLLTSIMSFGQFAKGDKFFGGTFSLHMQRAPDSKNGGLTNLVNSFSVNPFLGFLINENFAVGGQIGFSSDYSKSTNFGSYISEYKGLSISSSVFVKKYFKISDKFLFSIVGGFEFTRGTDTSTSTNTSTGNITESKSQNYQLSTSIRPSFIFFPTPKWGFEASIGSISHRYFRNLSTDEKSNNFNFSYETVGLGLSYYFRKSSQTEN